MIVLRKFFFCACICVFCGEGYSIQKKEDPIYPAVVLGGGIGALTASLYLGRAELHPVVIEGQNPGGLLTQSHSVQNWPGEMEIEGHFLTEKMRRQAIQNGAQFCQEEVVAVDFSKRPFVIQVRSVDGKETLRSFFAETCVIAMGTSPNYLGIPGETGPRGYWGKGVSNCAICDGNLYKGMRVGVVGGGDAAVLEALYLSNIAKEVVVFVRKDHLRAGEKKRVDMLLAKPNVRVMYNTQVAEIKGDGNNVQSVILKRDGKKKEMFSLDGLFLAIGSKPNSQLFKDVLKMDSEGYILVEKGQQTSVEGIYAVGDIVDPIFKQAISAAGDGAKAALQVQQYVSDRMNGLAFKKEPEKEKSFAASAEVVEIRSFEQFERELEKSEGPIVIDFYASWCGPCKRVAPYFEESALKLSGKVKFLKVNVDKLQRLSDTYNIRSMPTALLVDAQGDVLDRKVGLGPITHFLRDLEKKDLE